MLGALDCFLWTINVLLWLAIIVALVAFLVCMIGNLCQWLFIWPPKNTLFVFTYNNGELRGFEGGKCYYVGPFCGRELSQMVGANRRMDYEYYLPKKCVFQDQFWSSSLFLTVELIYEIVSIVDYCREYNSVRSILEKEINEFFENVRVDFEEKSPLKPSDYVAASTIVKNKIIEMMTAQNYTITAPDHLFEYFPKQSSFSCVRLIPGTVFVRIGAVNRAQNL